MPPRIADRLAALLEPAGLSVSRETRERLGTHVALLGEWQPVQNLVAPASLPEVWERHVLDGAQALAVAPRARTVCDLGSGAGFPGLVLAILLADAPGARVHLVESNRRKAAFLATVARATGAPAEVHAARVEDVVPARIGTADLVTARAFAPLGRLLELAAPLLARGATGAFHKGAGLAAEIEAAGAHVAPFDLLRHPSVTDPEATILEVRLRGPEAPGAPAGEQARRNG